MSPPEMLISQSALIPFDDVSKSAPELSVLPFCALSAPVCTGTAVVLMSTVPPSILTIDSESIPSPSDTVFNVPPVILKVSLT